MRLMGVDAWILNLAVYRERFDQVCATFGVPVRYIADAAEVATEVAGFDAVIATANTSVEWMASRPAGSEGAIRAYYVQDFEPLFLSSGVGRIPPRSGVVPAIPRPGLPDKDGVESVNCSSSTRASPRFSWAPAWISDVCRPRPRRDGHWPVPPLHIAAMIRPSSGRRRARETLAILQRYENECRIPMEFILFGSDSATLQSEQLPQLSACRNAGLLNSRHAVASLLNEVDVFVDFSSHQAMGLTALEAMACGAAVIIPEQGGARSFADANVNAIVVDTDSPDACLAALVRLTTDHELRRELQALCPG